MEGLEKPLEQPIDLPWVTSGVMGHYPQHQQPPLLKPGPAQYAPAPEPYNQYGYSNGLTSPQPSSQPGMPGLGYSTPQGFDTTGQLAPPGMKPRVTATFWEDEGSLCFQVEAKGVCVARREGTSQCFNFLEKRIDWKQQTIT
jgi:protein SOK2